MLTKCRLTKCKLTKCTHSLKGTVKEKFCRFQRIIFRKYTTNLKTTISQRSLRNLGLLLLLFEFIYIIDNIINTFVSCDQNSYQWQCSIIVMCLRLYHVTSTLGYRCFQIGCVFAEYDPFKPTIFIQHFINFRILRQEHQEHLMGLDQLLK